MIKASFPKKKSHTNPELVTPRKASESQTIHFGKHENSEHRRTRSDIFQPSSTIAGPKSARKAFEKDEVTPSMLRKRTHSADNVLTHPSQESNPLGFTPGDKFSLILESPVSSPAECRKRPEIFMQEFRDFAILLLKGFTINDLFTKDHKGHQLILDTHFNNLVDKIKTDILDESNEMIQQKYFSYYCRCLKIALNSCDYFTGYALYLALNSPEIEKLREKSYTISSEKKISTTKSPNGYLAIPLAVKKMFKKSFKIYDESNGVYHRLLNSHLSSRTVPWLIPIYKKADRINQMEEVTKKDIKNKGLAKIDLINFIKRFINPSLENEVLIKDNQSTPPSIHFSLIPKMESEFSNDKSSSSTPRTSREKLDLEALKNSFDLDGLEELEEKLKRMSVEEPDDSGSKTLKSSLKVEALSERELSHPGLFFSSSSKDSKKARQPHHRAQSLGDNLTQRNIQTPPGSSDILKDREMTRDTNQSGSSIRRADKKSKRTSQRSYKPGSLCPS